MANYAFKRGDIVHLDFSPQAGREMKDPHFALVVSKDEFNQQGMAMVCPITQGTFHREGGFTTSLMGTGMDTQGVVVSSMIQTLDMIARKAKFKERCDDIVLDEVLAKLEAIIGFSD